MEEVEGKDGVGLTRVDCSSEDSDLGAQLDRKFAQLVSENGEGSCRL